ncbi:MAG: hypothetical protein OEM26_10505 [Saprospiraceae bacterium]|nr:hypothetical protein [Saprospiraceae bacterium]
MAANIRFSPPMIQVKSVYGKGNFAATCFHDMSLKNYFNIWRRDAFDFSGHKSITPLQGARSFST